MSDIDIDELERRAEQVEYFSESDASESNASATEDKPHNINGDIDIPTFQDFEEEREYLHQDHKYQLTGLIDKWEHLLEDEGDVIDLNTGLIVQDHGHLRALNAGRIGNIGRIFEIESEGSSEEDQEDQEEIAEETDCCTPSSFYTACQQTPKLMNFIVEQHRNQWIL